MRTPRENREELERRGAPSDGPITFPPSKYLVFEARDSPTGRTKIVSVCAKSDGSLLGEIRWFGQWRQYVLWPNLGSVWNKGCLEDVNAVIAALMAAR